MTSVGVDRGGTQRPTYSYYYHDPKSSKRKSPDHSYQDNTGPAYSHQTTTSPEYSYQTITNPEQTRETQSSQGDKDTGNGYQHGYEVQQRTDDKRAVKGKPKRGSLPCLLYTSPSPRDS